MDATGALSDIRKLIELKASGALSEEEFASLKGDIFSRLDQRQTFNASNNRSASLRSKFVEANTTLTWQGLISSEFLTKSITSSVGVYRDKFARIIQRKDIKNIDITDPAALKAIMTAMSWNWAAFFGGGFWAAYRGAKYWLSFAIFSCLATIGADMFAIEWLGKVSWSVFLVYALYGDAYLLASLAEKHAQVGPVSIITDPKPSWARVGILAAMFILFGLVEAAISTGAA
jgi:hypothetical protein